jgi:DNA topoisomerase-1
MRSERGVFYDRLVGYQLSPLLWKKVRNYLSAGRVQSIAVRLIVDRERAINQFVPQEFWSIHARLHAPSDASKKGLFTANLIKVNQQDFVCGTEAEARAHVQALQHRTFQVSEVKRGTRKRKPFAPFTTSTLQQEGSRRLNFNTDRTMQIAQRLYEGIELGAEGTGRVNHLYENR